MTRLVRLVLAIATGAVLLAAAPAVLAATDPGTFDPQAFDLGIVLTAAGIPVAAWIIAQFINALKRIPKWGDRLDAGNEIFLSMIFAAGLIALAYVSIGVPISIASGFMAFLAWLNLTKFIGDAHDATPVQIRKAIAGKSS